LGVQAQGYTDWESLPQRAENNGLAPLAYLHLQAAGISIAEAPRRALSALTLRHRRANHIRCSTLAEILTALKEEDIHRICDIVEYFHNSNFITTQRLNSNSSDAKLAEANQARVLSTEEALFYS